MMDSTPATSMFEQMAINAKGYNPDHDYDPQVSLMYLFSAHLKQPVYFRLINGNITHSKSMSLCIKEMNVDDVIYMQDRNVLECWLAAYFIAKNAYYGLFTRLKDAKLLNKHSSKDIIEIAKSISKMKISGIGKF